MFLLLNRYYYKQNHIIFIDQKNIKSTSKIHYNIEPKKSSKIHYKINKKSQYFEGNFQLLIQNYRILKYFKEFLLLNRYY